MDTATFGQTMDKDCSVCVLSTNSTSLARTFVTLGITTLPGTLHHLNIGHRLTTSPYVIFGMAVFGTADPIGQHAWNPITR